jgi:hypothetical protein
VSKKQRQKPPRITKRLRPISDKRRGEGEALRAAQKPMARAWWEAVAKGKPCVVCGRPEGVQGHHVVSQAALRKVAKRFGYDLATLLWDERNGIAVCERCHSAHTSAKKRIPVSVVPASAFEFADELGLRWQVERTYRPATAVSG